MQEFTKCFRAVTRVRFTAVTYHRIKGTSPTPLVAVRTCSFFLLDSCEKQCGRTDDCRGKSVGRKTHSRDEDAESRNATVFTMS